MFNLHHLLLTLLTLLTVTLAGTTSRKVTPTTCQTGFRPHCCVDFPSDQTEITMYDSCSPMIPGDSCKEQTICCHVLQGNTDAHPWVYRRYGCKDVTDLPDANPQEDSNRHKMYYVELEE